jgi:signal transduction histidine kinase
MYLAILILIAAAGYLAWFRLDGLSERIETGRWGLLLPILALGYAAVGIPQYWFGFAVMLAGCLAMLFRPRAATRIVPYALLGLALIQVVIARRLSDGAFTDSRPLAGAGGSQLAWFETVLFLAAGIWLFLRLRVPGSDLAARRACQLWQSRTSGILRGQGFLVLLPTVILLGLMAVHGASGVAVDVGALAGALALAFRSRLWAATVAAAGLLTVGLYGVRAAMFFQGTPGVRWYGLAVLGNHTFIYAGLQGAILLGLGLWLTPRVIGEQLGLPAKELAAKTEQLTERVETLTQTRSDAVDTAAAELRRIERDLHDGAQARLVALGMSLRAAEKLFKTSPDAALALVSEAKESSSKALTELRDLVRGIYPPVLADRGLADAVRALALDTPLHTVIDIDLLGEVEMPVASAVYFAVAEILANVAKHSGARTVRIHITYATGMLRVQVTDDGAGGADPQQGTGLKGVERRLATFDGILAVSSPPGGPTIVVIEVPCASSSLKTSSC